MSKLLSAYDADKKYDGERENPPPKTKLDRELKLYLVQRHSWPVLVPRAFVVLVPRMPSMLVPMMTFA